MFLGSYLGLSAATVVLPMVSPFVLMLGMIGVIVLIVVQTSSWGVLRTGYEWRLPQWVGFGIAATVLFMLAVLILATDTVNPAIATCAGVVVAASIIVSAFVPRQSRVAPTP